MPLANLLEDKKHLNISETNIQAFGRFGCANESGRLWRRGKPPGLPPKRRSCSVAVSANLWASLGVDAGRRADPALAGRLRRKQFGAMEALEADVSRSAPGCRGRRALRAGEQQREG